MDSTVRAVSRALSDSNADDPPSAPVPVTPRSVADEARLRELTSLHWSFVGRLLRHLGVRSDLDDALQQVFITLMSKLSQVEVGKERAFLAACATNIAARHRRKLGVQQRTVEDAPPELVARDQNPEELAEQRSDLARLDAVLSTMPEDVRAVFLLYEVEELTMIEISLALEVPQGTVASRLRRAREIVRERTTR